MTELLFGSSCSTEIFIKLFTRSSRNRRRSFLISVNILSDKSAIESAIKIHVRHKVIVFNRCAKSHSWRNTGQPVKNCDRFTRKLIRLPSNLSLVFFTILFQVKVKRQTPQLLDHKNNPLEC